MTQLQEYLDKKRNALPLKLNIQFFADEGEGAEGDEGAGNDTNTGNNDEGSDDNQNDNNDTPVDVTFTPEQQTKMNEIIKKRVADEQKKAAEAVKESEKLAKMNAQQKQDYELEKYKKRVEELEAQDNLHQMSKEASKMLTEKGVSVTDELLEHVTRETAEETQKAVSTFFSLVDSEVQKQVAEKLRGGAPKGTTQTTKVEEEAWKKFL